MARTAHKAYTASSATVLTTELNSITTAANTAASSAKDNSSTLDLYVDLTLVLATQGTARVAGAIVLVYLVHALDGTNYDDIEVTCSELVCTFPLDAATTARRLTRRDIPIPPGLFKYWVRNQTGQTLAASGNTLSVRYHSLETA